MTTQLRIIPIDTRGLANVDVRALERDLIAATRNVVAEGQRYIATYPPQRLTKSGYRRTGTLKRSWSSAVQVTRRQIIGIVGSNSNIAPYNVYVQGPDQRALFDSAGWRDVGDLSGRMETQFQTRIQAVLDAHIRTARR